MRLSDLPVFQCLPQSLRPRASDPLRANRHEVANAMRTYAQDCASTIGSDRVTLRLLAAIGWATARIAADAGMATAPLAHAIADMLVKDVPDARTGAALANSLVEFCRESFTSAAATGAPWPTPGIEKLTRNLLTDLGGPNGAPAFLQDVAQSAALSPYATLTPAQSLYASVLTAWQHAAPAAERTQRADATDRMLAAMETGTLDLQNMALTSLPDLPPRLASLNVSGNPLGTLPPLPEGLARLDARDCQLGELHGLPASLTRLDVSRNRLTQLPELPGGLTFLDASDTALTRLHASLYALPRHAEVSVPTFSLGQEGFHEFMLRITDPDFAGPDLNRTPPRPAARHNPFNVFAASMLLSTPQIGVGAWFTDGREGYVREAWQAGASLPGNSDFTQFLKRLHGCAVKGLVNEQDVCAWLLKLQASPELMRLTFDIAREANQSCNDRVLLTLNQMTAASLAHEVSQGAYDERLPDLFKIGQGAFRLDQLEQIARRYAERDINARTQMMREHSIREHWSQERFDTRLADMLEMHDELEIHLALQVKLRDALDLPVDVREALYIGKAVSDRSIAAAQREVLAAEAHGLPHFLLVQWAPWQAVVQRLAPEAIESQRDALVDRLDEFDTRLNARLATLGLAGDADAQREQGPAIQRELEVEVYGATARTLLESRGQGALYEKLFAQTQTQL